MFRCENREHSPEEVRLEDRVAFPEDQRQEIRRVRREVQFSREICLSSGGIFSDMKWPLPQVTSQHKGEVRATGPLLFGK